MKRRELSFKGPSKCSVVKKGNHWRYLSPHYVHFQSRNKMIIFFTQFPCWFLTGRDGQLSKSECNSCSIINRVVNGQNVAKRNKHIELLADFFCFFILRMYTSNLLGEQFIFLLYQPCTCTIL